MKYLTEDKEKSEKQLIDKWKEKVEDKEEMVRNLEAKIKSLEA